MLFRKIEEAKQLDVCSVSTMEMKPQEGTKIYKIEFHGDVLKSIQVFGRIRSYTLKNNGELLDRHEVLDHDATYHELKYTNIPLCYLSKYIEAFPLINEITVEIDSIDDISCYAIYGYITMENMKQQHLNKSFDTYRHPFIQENVKHVTLCRDTPSIVEIKHLHYLKDIIILSDKPLIHLSILLSVGDDSETEQSIPVDDKYHMAVSMKYEIPYKRPYYYIPFHDYDVMGGIDTMRLKSMNVKMIGDCDACVITRSYNMFMFACMVLNLAYRR